MNQNNPTPYHSSKIQNQILLPSFVGVSIETAINHVAHTGHTDPLHLTIDFVAHCLMNTIHPEHVRKNVSMSTKLKKGIVVISDAIFHLIGKFGVHQLIHNIEHRGHNHQPTIYRFGPKIQELMDHHHAGPAFISLAIVGCLISEQVVKGGTMQKHINKLY